jgi:hypothetical protein
MNQQNHAARKREQRIRRNEPKHKRARKNCTVGEERLNRIPDPVLEIGNVPA